MFISPMLLQRVPEPFDSEDYLSELKLDGIRLLLTKFNDKFRLYTRHNNEVTSLFPEIYKDLQLPNGTVLDGELIVPGDKGSPDFDAVMERFKSKKSNFPLQFCVFDILYYKEEKVTSFPLIKRKELINSLDFNTERVIPVQWMIGNGIAYFNLVKEMDLEGIVLKKKDSMYQIDKRSDHWLKVINYKYQDVLITGILKKNQSFILSSLDKEHSLGVMEFVPIQERKKIYMAIEETGSVENDGVIWLKQVLPCNVKFRNWTKNNKLRIPSFHKWPQ